MRQGLRSSSPPAKFHSPGFLSARDTLHGQDYDDRAEIDEASSMSQLKRRRLNPTSHGETRSSTKGRGRERSGRRTSGGQRDAAKPMRAADGVLNGEQDSRPSGNSAGQTRASALNVHSYPLDHHPVGIAIWVIQKVDSARRERNCSSSSRESSPRVLLRLSSPAGPLQTLDEASEFEKGDDATDRRQAQRERKTKQRLDNWAKNKENDVVARAKLDAKKKFGSYPSTDPVVLSNGRVERPSPADEKEAYIRRRIRDDFSRLMERQTRIFADGVSRLEPFQPGFGQMCFPILHSASDSDARLAAACRLLVNVLPALAERNVSRTSQLAADSLIHALQTESLSPKTFVDAINTLSQQKDILEGTDHVLTRLFSRSTSSGDAKALRTSSGTDSKLFATTDGAFVIYNTVEYAEMTNDAVPQDAVPQDADRSNADSSLLPDCLSVRERKPNPETINNFSNSRPVPTRKSASGRSPSFKAPKAVRPSRLRRPMSFEKSSSPSRKHDKLTDDTTSLSHHQLGMKASSKMSLSAQLPTQNEYLSKEPAPVASCPDQPIPQTEVNDQLVQSLLDWALLASHEDSDSISSAGGHATSLRHQPQQHGETGSPWPLRTDGNEARPSMDIMNGRPNAASAFASEKLPNSSCDTSSKQITTFAGLMEMLASSETDSSAEQPKNVAALYDHLTKAITFPRAQRLGFCYPEIPRPFTDRDGWNSTGVVDYFREELIIVDEQNWAYLPNQSPGRHGLLQRLKRKSQLENERIYGFPSVTADSQGTRVKRQRLDEDSENVAYEKLMFDVRKAAEARDLPCGTSLSWEVLVESIKAFDAAHGITGSFEDIPEGPVVDAVFEETNDDTRSQQNVSDHPYTENDDDSDYQPDGNRVQKCRRGDARTSAARARKSLAINGGKRSSRKQRYRRGSASPRTQGNTTVTIDTIRSQSTASMSANSNEKGQTENPSAIELALSPRLESGENHGSQPSVRPRTFNTFNLPLTLLNSPTTPLMDTPTLTQFSINNTFNQSISPLPTSQTGSMRFPSTTSISASSPSLSVHSRAQSIHSLDMENAKAYNMAKGYNTNIPVAGTSTYSSPIGNHSASVSTTRASSRGLNGVSSSSSSSRGGSAGGSLAGGSLVSSGSVKKQGKQRAGTGRGHRRRSKAPDFKMMVNNANTNSGNGNGNGNGCGSGNGNTATATATATASKAQPKAVRGGERLRFG